MTLILIICLAGLVAFLLRRWIRNKLTPKSVTALLILVALGAVGTIAQGWYYDRFVWPEKLQKELLGRAIAGHSFLLHYEGFSHLGQGAFQWIYRLEPSAETIAEFCGSQALAACRFERLGKPAPNVETSLTYERGTLSIEETWF